MPTGVAELELTPSPRDAGPNAVQSMVEGYRLAAAALTEMQQHRVLPTARAYELWLSYRMNANPTLTERMNALLRARQELTPALIDALRDEFGLEGYGGEEGHGADTMLGMSDNLQDMTQTLATHANSGRAAIREYGDALARGVVELGKQPTRDESLRVISRLTADTLLAAERNRELEAQLAATSAKVDKLRKLLVGERKAASTDQLTGLANRREFDARLKRTISKVVAEPTVPASLLLLDIDHFKRFNDQYGHRAGDLVLRLVGGLLIDSIKGRDMAARYGGEEFAIILIGADLDSASKVARQIGATLAHKRVRLSSDTENGHGRVTISIGVAQFRLEDSVASVIDRADSALYAAKNAGRNRVTTERDLPGVVL